MTVTGIIIGLIIGALDRLVLPGRQAIPIWLTSAAPGAWTGSSC